MIKKTKQVEAVSQEQTNGNYVLVDRRALYFVGALILALTFSTGMFYAKSKSTGGSAGVTTAIPTAAQQQQQQAPAVNVSMDQIRSLFGNGNITFGDKNSKLVLVEFSDPSCPYCSAAGGLNPTLNKQMGTQFVMKADGGSYVAPVPEMKKLVDSGKAAMVWVYAKGHGNGELSTQALYCANEKGKFWAVHDLLMATDGYALQNNTVKNDPTQSGTLADFLKSAVDPTFMKSCLDSKKYASRLTSDMALATQFGFNGTPDFFINTTNIEGAESFTSMQPIVDAALK